jgi:hypothetical protein
MTRRRVVEEEKEAGERRPMVWLYGLGCSVGPGEWGRCVVAVKEMVEKQEDMEGGIEREGQYKSSYQLLS